MVATITARFSSRALMATPGAIKTLGDAGITAASLLMRHFSCDWGDVCDEDRATNDWALANGARILSVYNVGEGKVWIITEADRSSTTLLLPEEY